MATAHQVDTKLQHVYFFIEGQSTRDVPELQDSRNSYSRGSQGASAPQTENVTLGNGELDTSSACSSSGSLNMNPLALAFRPHAKQQASPAPPTGPLYQVGQTSDKGLGIFATIMIPAGTAIIQEKALLTIKEYNLARVWSAYCGLSYAHKEKFNKLHCFMREDFEQISRIQVIENLDTDQQWVIDKQVLDRTRVLSIFACNVFGMSQAGLGIFVEASRLNHSCAPNVHHSYNPNSHREVVYAIRDIYPGEELLTTYIGGAASYQVTHQRRKALQHNYGFICFCPACVDPTGASDARRHALNHLIAGYSSYISGTPTTSPVVPHDAASALQHVETIIRLLHEEGLRYMELAKAYRTASTEAANLNLVDQAFHYARLEGEVEQTCLGTDLQDLVKIGAATSCWIKELEKRFNRPKQPSKSAKKAAKRRAKAESERLAAEAGEARSAATEVTTGPKAGAVREEKAGKDTNGTAQTKKHGKKYQRG